MNWNDIDELRAEARAIREWLWPKGDYPIERACGAEDAAGSKLEEVEARIKLIEEHGGPLPEMRQEMSCTKVVVWVCTSGDLDNRQEQLSFQFNVEHHMRTCPVCIANSAGAQLRYGDRGEILPK